MKVFKILPYILLITSLSLQASSSLSYSGRLVNSDGSPVTGPVNLRFDLAYTNAPTVIVCSQLINNVALSHGVFHTKLDPDCSPTTLQQVLSHAPVGESVAIRVTDDTHSKTYSFQALHAMPYATIAKQIDKLGATNGQVLAWDGTKWAPTNPNTASGSVTAINTGAGLAGGPITNSGTISIADGGVTDVKLASGISRAKLANGTPNNLIVNNGAGALAEIAVVPVFLGGTGANTVAGARSNLGLGTAAVANIGAAFGDVMSASAVPSCLAFEKLQMTLGPTYTWTCVADNDSPDATKLPLAGGTMSGAINMGAQKITNLATPTVTTDAATKAYVDAASSQWTTLASNIYFNTANVGIGTTGPTEKLTVVGNASVSGRLKLQSDTANFVEFKAPAGLATSLTLNFPGTLGSAGNALTTDGAGNLSWATFITSTSAMGGDLSGTISNAQIVAGSITDAEVSAGAAISQSKINGLTTALANKENTIAAGTTAQYWRGDKTWQTLNTTAVPEGTNLYFTSPRVLAVPLSGFSAGAGTITASDSVLSGMGKLQGNIDAIATAATTDFVNATGDTMSGSLSMGTNKITNLGTPTAATDAATKAYVDSQITSASDWTKTVNDLSYTLGRVGIGSASPTATLHVLGTSAAGALPNVLTVQGAGSSDAGGSQGISLIAGQSNSGRPAAKLTLGGSDYNAGGVLIQAAQPDNNGAAGIVEIYGGDGWNNPGGNVYIAGGNQTTSGNVLLGMTSGGSARGKVGIGTNAPTSLLHVNGSAFATDFTSYDSGYRVNSGSAGYGALKIHSPIGGSGRIAFASGVAGWAWDTYLVRTNANELTLSSDASTGAASLKLNGDLKLKSDTANYVMLKAPASLGSNLTWTLPANNGSAGNALVTDGAGALSWSAVATTASSIGGDLTGTIANAQLAAGAIVDADISASAAIAQSKIANLTTDLAAKEPLMASGTTAQYRRGDKTWQTLNTTAVPEGLNLYFLDSRVRAALMSGYTTGTALPVAATDTLMEAIGKLEGQIIANAAGSVTWQKSGSDLNYTAGNVGVGTTTPSAKLEVSGQIVSKVYNNGSSMTFNMNNGNAQFTTASCGAMTLQNVVDGASYTIAVQGATAGTCTFTDSAGSRTFRFSPANAATTASTHTIYSMQVMGTNVYVSWISGF